MLATIRNCRCICCRGGVCVTCVSVYTPSVASWAHEEREKHANLETVLDVQETLSIELREVANIGVVVAHIARQQRHVPQRRRGPKSSHVSTTGSEKSSLKRSFRICRFFFLNDLAEKCIQQPASLLTV